MVEAVRKYKRVFQTGEQQRSHPATRKAVELIRNGRIGKIQSIIGYNYPSPYECDFPAQPIPDGLDWDRWCGPNEVVPYHTDIYLSRIPYAPRATYPVEPAEKYAVGPGWMSFRPYSGGELPNWGCHGLSMVQWALEMDKSGPVEIWVDPAEKLPNGGLREPGEPRSRRRRASQSRSSTTSIANGVVLKLSGIDDRGWAAGRPSSATRASITIFREGYECDPKGLDEDPLPADAIRVYESDNHMENFFECVRSRKDPIMNGRERASRGHPVPPGQHRPLARPPAEVGSRRRRSSPATTRPTSTSTARNARATKCPSRCSSDLRPQIARLGSVALTIAAWPSPSIEGAYSWHGDFSPWPRWPSAGRVGRRFGRAGTAATLGPLPPARCPGRHVAGRGRRRAAAGLHAAAPAAGSRREARGRGLGRQADRTGPGQPGGGAEGRRIGPGQAGAAECLRPLAPRRSTACASC